MEDPNNKTCEECGYFSPDLNCCRNTANCVKADKDSWMYLSVIGSDLACEFFTEDLLNKQSSAAQLN